jgi:hypothetical protein
MHKRAYESFMGANLEAKWQEDYPEEAWPYALVNADGS